MSEGSGSRVRVCLGCCRAVAQELYEDWEWEKQKQQWCARLFFFFFLTERAAHCRLCRQLEEKETAEAVEAIRNEIPNVVPSKIISGSDFPPLMQWAQFCQLMEKDPRWKRVPGVKVRCARQCSCSSLTLLTQRVQLFEDHIRTLEEQQAQIESEERKVASTLAMACVHLTLMRSTGTGILSWFERR